METLGNNIILFLLYENICLHKSILFLNLKTIPYIVTIITCMVCFKISTQSHTNRTQTWWNKFNSYFPKRFFSLNIITNVHDQIKAPHENQPDNIEFPSFLLPEIPLHNPLQLSFLETFCRVAIWL